MDHFKILLPYYAISEVHGPLSSMNAIMWERQHLPHSIIPTHTKAKRVHYYRHLCTCVCCLLLLLCAITKRNNRIIEHTHTDGWISDQNIRNESQVVVVLSIELVVVLFTNDTHNPSLCVCVHTSIIEAMNQQAHLFFLSFSSLLWVCVHK